MAAGAVRQWGNNDISPNCVRNGQGRLGAGFGAAGHMAGVSPLVVRLGQVAKSIGMGTP
jgi:hypothetical protein